MGRELLVEWVPINDVQPYARNSKAHPKEQVDLIAKSISQMGWTNPLIVDGANVIVAGHGRLAAAKALNLEHVPIIRVTDLSEDQIMAYRILDNKSAESHWELPVLAFELGTLERRGIDLTLSGFGLEDAKRILQQHLPPAAPGESQSTADPDETPEPPVIVRSKLGEVWTLGRHRLMCGDSTSKETVDRLLAGEKIDMVFTDPPYGIDYQDVKHNHNKIEGDSTLSEIPRLLSVLIGIDAPMFICCNWKSYSAFESALISAKKPPKACIVWDKKNRVQNLDKFGKQHEFVLYHGPFGGQPTVDVDVWSCSREVRADHPTAKPTELIERALIHFPGNVLDLFGGSGSTLIACEKTGRTCFMMELDPHYVDVILERWARFTGQDPSCEDGRKWSEIKALSN